MKKALVVFLVAHVAACTSTTTLPTGSLAGPVAMAIAQTSGGPVVFVADATGNDLRAFLVDKQLFVRGPNAISPLSIDVGFRPSRLAAGIALDASGTGHPIIVAAGSATRLALIDANEETVAPTPATHCLTGTITASCLPAPATDVAIAGGGLFAALAAPAQGGAPSLAIFQLGWSGGPTATFERAIDLSGSPDALAVLSDGSRVYVGDRASARVTEVNVAAGVLRDLAAPGPVARLAVVPGYTAADGTAHPEGELVLAVLADGRLEPLDVAQGAPVADPFDATRPATPLDFGSPVFDVAFLPCLDASCFTNLQLSASDVEPEPALAFASLADGTAVGLEPDPTRQQLFVPVTPRAAGQTALIVAPSASDATFTDPAHPEKSGTVALAGKGIRTAIGFTRSERWTVTRGGVVPGLDHRPATLAAGGATLADDDPAAFTGADVHPGDSVDVAVLDSACAALQGGATAAVQAVAAGALGLAGWSRDPSGCPAARVIYSVRVQPPAWTVVGSASGYAGRATNGQPFTFAGGRFFYPPSNVAPSLPSPAVRVGFTLPSTTPTDLDSTFAFGTTSGFGPFLVASSGIALTAGGLAGAVGAVYDKAKDRQLVYVAQAGASALVQVEMGLASEATGTVVFH